MKVLIIIGGDIKRFKELGGANTNTPKLPLSYPFYGYLKKEGVDVEVISLNFESLEGQATIGFNMIRGYFKIFSLAKYIKSFDAVITFGFIGPLTSISLALHGQNRKVFTVVYANESSKLKNLFSKVKKSLFLKGLKLCGGLIYMTKEQIEQACNEFNLPSKRVFHLPVGVDVAYFNEGNHSDVISPEVLELPLKKYVVVSGDQLRNELEIVNVMEDSGLKLLRLTQSMKTQLFWENYNKNKSSNIEVFCKAHLSFQDVRYGYQNALCVLNLVDNSWQPAGWTVLTEGMACGIPVIMNQGLVTRELKRYSPSLPLVEVAQMLRKEEIQEVLKKLINQPSYAKELGIRGREFVEKNLPIEKTGKCLLSILYDKRPI